MKFIIILIINIKKYLKNYIINWKIIKKKIIKNIDKILYLNKVLKMNTLIN